LEQIADHQHKYLSIEYWLTGLMAWDDGFTPISIACQTNQIDIKN